MTASNIAYAPCRVKIFYLLRIRLTSLLQSSIFHDHFRVFQRISDPTGRLFETERRSHPATTQAGRSIYCTGSFLTHPGRSRMFYKPEGIAPAMLTAFDEDGSINKEVMGDIVDFCIDSGCKRPAETYPRGSASTRRSSVSSPRSMTRSSTPKSMQRWSASGPRWQPGAPPDPESVHLDGNHDHGLGYQCELCVVRAPT